MTRRGGGGGVRHREKKKKDPTRFREGFSLASPPLQPKPRTTAGRECDRTAPRGRRNVGSEECGRSFTLLLLLLPMAALSLALSSMGRESGAEISFQGDPTRSRCEEVPEKRSNSGQRVWRAQRRTPYREAVALHQLITATD
ncbi:hypothetical protein HPB50_012269 [Hyalomma asiaticum]|uniref:Uncharacterized protein n=1 Tax=Hyalomma asiaticum TaxID=266040 RepID=A0ACB7S509_HYAAI|nr:hypothetical protein HPB50_012269 [Hyalomma asiaticum]